MRHFRQATSFRGVDAGLDALLDQGCRFHPRNVRHHAERRSARHRRVTLQISARNRILFEAAELQHDGRLTLALQDDRSLHLIQVLKLQPRDQVKIGIVNGPFGQATVLHTHPDIVLQCLLWQPPSTPGQLYLVLAMPRPKVMKRLWSTLACLGVTRVYITGAEKVEKVYFASHALKPESFYPELIHGAEQAGDTRLPAVYLSKSLHATLTAVQSAVDDINPSQQSPKPTLKPCLHAKMPGQMLLLSEQALARNILKSPQALQAGTSQGVQCLFPEGASSISLPAMQYQMQGSSPAGVTPQMHAAATNAPDSNLPMEAIKLLAHTVGRVSVHQAVASHMAVHGNSSMQAATGFGSETQKQPVIVLAIGPEGGWVDSEIALLTNQYSFQVVTTAGNRVLDTTTAVISLVSLAVDAVSM
ncbi:hypothetical protein WJX79_010422 [Trebouxia sp. C0005]